MLRYVSAGTRSYFRNPVPVVTRLNWEFEAVIGGRMAPTFAHGVQRPLAERTLWVFPPECAHGWTGDPQRSCEMVVIQPAHAPEPLATLARKRGHLSATLSAEDVSLLRELARELLAEQARPSALGALRESKAVSQLCLIALRAELLPAPAAHDLARERAEMALAWYLEHLARDPSLAQVARAIGSCESHLRRLFHRAHGRSPHAVLAEARIARACELMADGRLALEAVARACGFSDGSAFSRAFRLARGVPPSRWRAGV